MLSYNSNNVNFFVTSIPGIYSVHMYAFIIKSFSATTSGITFVNKNCLGNDGDPV